MWFERPSVQRSPPRFWRNELFTWWRSCASMPGQGLTKHGVTVRCVAQNLTIASEIWIPRDCFTVFRSGFRPIRLRGCGHQLPGRTRFFWGVPGTALALSPPGRVRNSLPEAMDFARLPTGRGAGLSLQCCRAGGPVPSLDTVSLLFPRQDRTGFIVRGHENACGM